MKQLARRTTLKSLAALVGLARIPVRGRTGTTDDIEPVQRRVLAGYDTQPGQGIVRTGPDTLAEMGIKAGETVAIGQARGGRGIPARVWRSDREDWDRGAIRVGHYIRFEAGTYPGDTVSIRPIDPSSAERVVLEPLIEEFRIEGAPIERATLREMLHMALLGRPLIRGTKLPIRVVDDEMECLECYVWATEPDGHVRITEETAVVLRNW